MRFKLFPLLVVVFVCSLAAHGQTVIESDSSVVFNDKTAVLSLVIDSRSVSRDMKIDLELLDAESKVRASASPDLRLKRGKQAYKVSLPVGDLLKAAGDDIAWYRLRYRVADSSGIISLSELLKDDFELRVASFERVVPGQSFRVRVRALHPLTKRAIKRVLVDGELDVDINTDSDDDKLKIKAQGSTNSDGILELNFKIPDNIKLDGNGNLTIEGNKGGVIRKIDEDLDSDDSHGSVFLTSDKPLYQPGQSFSVRGLYFDVNNVAVSGSDLEFSIEDEEDTVLFRQTVKTSDFGIASISWKIPENAKLGTYRVVVEADEELRTDRLNFKVSRYDLPNFSINVKPDKPYYLPNDQRADIAINADYLFGKPVNKGKVRVVQESDRRWNWRTQKYDVEEKNEVEGETDASGKYVAKFDLTKENKELQDSQWRRFEDLRFAAYYTDLSTNRTEQKRFEIRLTKEPIHIYLIRHDYLNPKLPLIAYVSTFYADGTPAVCNVEIKNLGETIDRFKTNSLGVGKFEIKIPREHIQKSVYGLRIVARDKKGQQGTFDEDFDLDAERDALQLITPRTIYKPGESIDINIISTQQSGFIYVDIVKDWTVIDSRVVSLRNGKAFVPIPYRTEFKGELTVAAYSDQDTSYWDSRMHFSRGIIFPEQQNLKLNAKFSSDTYRPNADAKVKFSVFDGSGRTAESALGIVVFDKAVEQRAKTDAEFGSYFSGFSDLMGYGKSFGNLSVKDLNDLDLSKPIPAEMDLAAEVMLAGNYYYPRIYHGGGNESEAKSLYQEYFTKQLKPVEDVLKKHFEKYHAFPNDDTSLRQILNQNGVDFDGLKDPWGQNYHAAFTTEKTQATVSLRTVGPDKKLDTGDDITVATAGVAYFTPVGEVVDTAVKAYHTETGGFIRDLPTLSAEVLKSGIDLSKLKDRWNHDYQITFEVTGRNYLIRFRSLGPNGIYDPNNWNSDDFDIWKNYTDYFYKSENEINEILSNEVNVSKKPFPKDEAEFAAMLKKNGLGLESIKDGFGRPVYITATYRVRYVDKTTYENGKQTIKPATDQLKVFSIRSKGLDELDVADDFDLANFSSVITEFAAYNGFSKAEVNSVAFSGAKGAIRGTVVDPNGAVVAGAVAVASDENDATKTYSATTNEDGEFLLGNLPSGKFQVKVSASGFKSYVLSNLEVRSQNLVEMKITLEVGAAAETVTVAAEAEVVNTSSSSVSTNVTKTGSGRIVFPYVEQTSTPRVREYFPETLVWQPELLTDKKGKAEMTFKMADNITTWKMYTIASTRNGKIGVAEKEITAFQPFFVDLDPPKFLTEGDEIYLPTQVRNYTDKKQQVDVTMAKGDWFSFLGEDKKRIDVDAGNSQNTVFGFKAVSAIKDGKQRVTAIARTDSDAIEKPVTVRPNGQEIVRTDSRVFNGNATFDVNFPANAMAKTQKAELKIYPNLFSHVSESVEGLLERPYGCGEQTISSTYPNLMILKFVRADSPLRQKAKKYLQKGYERLLGYQIADGGFTYWGGKDTSDVALTAYAIRFLNDAKSQITVDEDVIKKAEDWLIKQQRADGSWNKKYSWETSENAGRTKLITTYVARSLAMLKSADKSALTKALDYLRTRNTEIDEPYALALFGLAALDAGNAETASEIAKQLETMAIEEGGSAYWKLETNTPFYGWGTAGRIETTALVLQLLIRDAETPGHSDAARKDLISKGTLFLLKNKDRYGVWYSTQTTINVLDAFLAALAGQKTTENQTIQVSVNGEVVQNLTIPADKIDPATIDLTGKLNAESNRVEVRGSDNSTLMSQIVSAHFIDWRDSDASNRTVNQSRALRLDYKCDKTAAAIMEDVVCSVEAERIGFQGYGMLLAEIGTPPGADVSRESLEKAIESDWSISRYDVLPDRIVVYMWSKAGGTRFNFKFRPRYGINAQTPASIVYDYYNPEAQAMAAPLRFVVK